MRGLVVELAVAEVVVAGKAVAGVAQDTPFLTEAVGEGSEWWFAWLYITGGTQVFSLSRDHSDCRGEENQIGRQRESRKSASCCLPKILARGPPTDP